MIHWVHQHLAKWGQYVQLGRGRGSAGLSASWESVGRSNISQAIVPIKDIELSRTHDWVASLNDDEQRLLFYMYCTPATARGCAIKLNISLRTLYARLHTVQAEYARGLEERTK
jgi:hypothetical protein